MLVALACGFAESPANLIPSSGWRLVSPRPAIEPAGSAGGGQLSLKARDVSSFGQWTIAAPGVKGGGTYRFEVDYLPQGVESSTSVSAILSWYSDDAGTKLLRRDYADPEVRGGEWAKLTRTLETPAGTRSAKVELGLRWTTGSVVFKNARLMETAPLQHRRVRVVTTRLRVPGPTTVAENLKRMGALIDRAAQERPDLVVMAEILPQYRVEGKVHELAEKIPGRITAALAEKARQHHTYLVTGMLEADGEAVYNTAVLIDRQGRVAGKYRKVHLPLAEVESGLTPGSEYPVFTTDFGKVGILICWDNSFPEAARTLRLNGAEMLVLPVMGEGEPRHWDVISRARAIDNGIYMVASMNQEWPSRIIDPRGEVIAETSDPFGVAVSEIDLDRQDGVYWMSVGPGLGEPKSLYMRERRPETYGPMTR